MKVVVVGTNQKDRERVAKVIKDRYGRLAEENADLLKKLQRSNDAWIRGREQIAALKAERDNERKIKEAEKKILLDEVAENKRLRETGEELRDYLIEEGGNERLNSVDIPDEIWIPFIEALRGGEVK